jgi:hypothetical protein
MDKHIDCGPISDEYSFNFQSLHAQPVHVLTAVKQVNRRRCRTRLLHKTSRKGRLRSGALCQVNMRMISGMFMILYIG